MIGKVSIHACLTIVILTSQVLLSESTCACCDVNNGGCGPYATCSICKHTKTVVCTCKAGYTDVGKLGKVICKDSCEVKNGGCDPNAVCSHAPRTNEIVCNCKTGYTNVGKGGKVVCQDSCEINNGGCGLHTVCSHEPKTNAVRCVCKRGYINAGKNGLLLCKDACLVYNGGCGKHAICSHDSKSYDVVCKCKSGFKNIGTSSNVICKAISKPRVVPKPKPRRPTRPVDFDAIHDHRIIFQDDGFLYGVITVKLCRPSLFIRKTSRGVLVCSHLQNLLEAYLAKKGISGHYRVEFVKVDGYGEFMRFYYKVKCSTTYYETVSYGLIHGCQQKCLHEKFRQAKKPDSSESSSQSDEN